MTSQSALHYLLMPVTPLDAGMSIADVADRLLTPECKAYLSLPVVDADGRPLGLISRYALQDIFMKRYGRELHGRKPVCEVMNPTPLVVSLNARLEEVAQLVTSQLDYPITEDFILVDGAGRYQGLATVLDLLKAMEKHVSQRNAELRRSLLERKEPRMQLVQAEKVIALDRRDTGFIQPLNGAPGGMQNNVHPLRPRAAS